MIETFTLEKKDICPICGSNYNNFKGPFEKWHNGSCNCYQQNKLWRDYSMANLPHEFYTMDFSDFKLTEEENQKEYYKNIKKYIDFIDNVFESGSSLFLYNDISSTGKTFFATSILKEAYRKKYSIKFVNFIHIYNKISEKNDNDNFDNLLRELNNIDFLVIDSVDKEIKTNFLSDQKVLNFLEEFLKIRYKPIIFTSQNNLHSNIETLKIIKSVLKNKIFELHINNPKSYNLNNYWDRIMNTKKEIIK